MTAQPWYDPIGAALARADRGPVFVAVPRPAGLVAAGNIDLMRRPQVTNPDGSVSTVRSITVTGDGGRATLLPTVSDDGRILSNPEALDLYQRTGRNLGVFGNERAADAYARALHDEQAHDYGLDLAREAVANNYRGRSYW